MKNKKIKKNNCLKSKLDLKREIKWKKNSRKKRKEVKDVCFQIKRKKRRKMLIKEKLVLFTIQKASLKKKK